MRRRYRSCAALLLALMLALGCARTLAEDAAYLYAYSGAGTVKLYDAQTGEVTAVLPDGTLVRATQQSEGMRYVSCAAGEGWAAEEFLMLSLPAQQTLPAEDPRDETLAPASAQAADPFQVLTLGTYTSVLRAQKGRQTIASYTLLPALDAPEGREMADIYAPREGKAMLREKPSKSAKGIGPLTAGILVAVLEYGESFCHVTTGRLTGYVLTTSLRFHPVLHAADPAPRAALLSYKGYTNGSTAIGLRLDAKNGSPRPIEFDTGTPVTVLSGDEEWAEIEVKGRYGFVPAEFITYTD